MTNRSIDDYVRWRANSQALQRGDQTHALCHAPFASLLFDTRGYVRSCCQSLTHSIGNIARQSLREIWDGEVNAALRSKMTANELPAGCATCKWEIERGNFDQTFARTFDYFQVAAKRPVWPQNMWFLLSNTCNLECVQCYGEFSSSIRKNRDRLPPLPHVYHDAFFAELREFLPHLTLALFLGGETFLSTENYRIWDMMIEDHSTTHSHIVTNGTVFSKGVERVVSSLPCSISISLDGATKDTVESIRRNAQYEKIIANIRKFQAYARVELSFCVMPQNYHEFPDFLLLAEELGCDAGTNTVYHPAQHSLCALPADRLAQVLHTWEKRHGEVAQQLGRHQGLWDKELSRVRRWLESPDGPPNSTYLSSISARMNFGHASTRGLPLVPDATADEETELGTTRTVLKTWSAQACIDEAILDEHDILHCEKTSFGGLEREYINGRPLSVFLMMLRERYGEDVSITGDECSPGQMDRTMEFTNLTEESTQVRWVARSSTGSAAGTKRFLLAVKKKDQQLTC